MTPIQQAAERLRRVNSGESIDEVYGAPWQPTEHEHPYHADLRLALGHYLALEPALRALVDELRREADIAKRDRSFAANQHDYGHLVGEMYAKRYAADRLEQIINQPPDGHNP
jgi:hypothetical protein